MDNNEISADFLSNDLMPLFNELLHKAENLVVRKNI
jgi:hypothetical protein